MSDTANMDLATRASWQKWEMDNLRAHKQRRSKAKINTDLIQAIKEKQAEIQDQANKNGYKAGYEKGFNEGFATGKENGWQSGTEQGYQDGLQRGTQDGYAQGLVDGQKDGNTKAQQSAAQLGDIVQEANKVINNLEQEIGQAVVKLAINIAEQVLRNELQTKPDHILAIINEAIEKQDDKNNILRIHLNPTDLELVQKHWQDDTELDFKLLANDEIQPGGCIIDTVLGSVDASLATRWQRIIGALGYQHELG